MENLRTRLLALRLLETVLPPGSTDVASTVPPSQSEAAEQRQIVDVLLSDMSAAVWSSSVPAAVQVVTRHKRQMEAGIAQLSAGAAELSATASQSVGEQSTVSAATSSCCSSTDIADVTFDVDKLLNCSVENGQTLIHGAGGRGYGLASIPISSGCYHWKVIELCTFHHHHHHHHHDEHAWNWTAWQLLPASYQRYLLMTVKLNHTLPRVLRILAKVTAENRRFLADRTE